jgi:hypothetical protein
MPTSSAIRIRTGSSLSAISKGTSWYGRGSTAMCPKERNGPALERTPSLTASRRRRHERWSPTSSGSGSANVAGPTGSRAVRIPAISSSVPPSGRNTSRSSSDSGSTTHSRPRALTSEPTAKVTRHPRRRLGWRGRLAPRARCAESGSRCSRRPRVELRPARRVPGRRRSHAAVRR